jgi:hypothetical protein
MINDSDKYDKEIIGKISNEEQWPKIDNTELIFKLLEIADKQHKSQTIEGLLSSLLIYQQIVEEYLINLLKLSNLYIQAEVWPTRLNLRIKNKLMFGQLLQEHNRTIDFDKKAELLNECREFNETRIKFVHHLLKFNTQQEIIDEAKESMDKFDKISNLYNEGKAHVEWLLTDLQERVNWRDLM